MGTTSRFPRDPSPSRYTWLYTSPGMPPGDPGVNPCLNPHQHGAETLRPCRGLVWSPKLGFIFKPLMGLSSKAGIFVMPGPKMCSAASGKGQNPTRSWKGSVSIGSAQGRGGFLLGLSRENPWDKLSCGCLWLSLSLPLLAGESQRLFGQEKD